MQLFAFSPFIFKKSFYTYLLVFFIYLKCFYIYFPLFLVIYSIQSFFLHQESSIESKIELYKTYFQLIPVLLSLLLLFSGILS